MSEQLDDLPRAEPGLAALAADPDVQITVERADGSHRHWALAGPVLLSYAAPDGDGDTAATVAGAAPRAEAGALIAGDLGLPPRPVADDVRLQVGVDPALQLIALLSGPDAPPEEPCGDAELAEQLADFPAPALDWLAGVQAAARISITGSSPLRSTELLVTWSAEHTATVAVGVRDGEAPVAIAALLDDARLTALLAALLEG